MSAGLRAVLLVAGRGSRFGGGIAKQFEDLGGIPVYLHGLRALAEVAGMEGIVIVTPPEGVPDEYRGGLADIDVPLEFAIGGARRQDSVAAGLDLIAGRCEVAIVHDGARPFPPPAAMKNLADAAREAGGGLLAARATDTVKVAGLDGRVARTLDRSNLWLAQTPQAIRADHLAEAIALMRGNREFTDEAAVLEAMGVAPALIESPAENFKITHPADLARARAILADMW